MYVFCDLSDGEIGQMLCKVSVRCVCLGGRVCALDGCARHVTNNRRVVVLRVFGGAEAAKAEARFSVLAVSVSGYF